VCQQSFKEDKAFVRQYWITCLKKAHLWINCIKKLFNTLSET